LAFLAFILRCMVGTKWVGRKHGISGAYNVKRIWALSLLPSYLQYGMNAEKEVLFFPYPRLLEPITGRLFRSNVGKKGLAPFAHNDTFLSPATFAHVLSYKIMRRALLTSPLCLVFAMRTCLHKAKTVLAKSGAGIRRRVVGGNRVRYRAGRLAGVI
jgi:hypothetical protein